MLVTVSIIILVVYVILGYKKPGLALVTLPIAIALPLLYLRHAILIEDLWFGTSIYYIPLILLATLGAVLLSEREPGLQRWPQHAAKWILISLAALLLLAVMSVLFGVGGVIGFLLFVLF